MPVLRPLYFIVRSPVTLTAFALIILAGLIHAIQEPPVRRVGVVDVETFFPAAGRFELAMGINNLLAAPGFAAWMGDGDS